MLTSITRPPDTEDLQVLEITVPGNLESLGAVDRLSLRLGLWLLLRAQQPHRIARRVRQKERLVNEALAGLALDHRRHTPGEMAALLTHDLQRGMR